MLKLMDAVHDQYCHLKIDAPPEEPSQISAYTLYF